MVCGRIEKQPRSYLLLCFTQFAVDNVGSCCANACYTINSRPRCPPLALANVPRTRYSDFRADEAAEEGTSQTPLTSSSTFVRNTMQSKGLKFGLLCHGVFHIKGAVPLSNTSTGLAKPMYQNVYMPAAINHYLEGRGYQKRKRSHVGTAWFKSWVQMITYWVIGLRNRRREQS